MVKPAEAKNGSGTRNLPTMNEIRCAWRVLLRNPGFTTIAILTLALGIGANVAVFSFVDQLLLRALPVKNPKELALLAVRYPDHTTYTFNYPLYRDYRDNAGLFAGMAAYQEQSVSLATEGDAQRARALVVSENYFEILGVRALIGRTFQSHLHDGATDPGGVVISHGLWHRRFGGDPSMIGQLIRINGITLP